MSPHACCLHISEMSLPVSSSGGVWINAHWYTHIPLGHSEPTGWNQPGWLRMPKQICEDLAKKYLYL